MATWQRIGEQERGGERSIIAKLPWRGLMACGVEVKASMGSGGKEKEEAEEAQKRMGDRCLPFVPLIPLQWRAAKGSNTVTAP